MRIGRVAPTLENLYTSSAFERFRLIERTMAEHDVPDEAFEPMLNSFLESSAFRDCPSNRLAALMWASIARAAALGQKEPPNAGTSNDINALSFMPFCDAMFIDNGGRGLWEKIPKAERPTYARARLFSYNTKDEFMTYLEEIERQADPEVVRAAREVYGEPEPFVTMYDH
jgi:hypothetical protein